MLGMITVTAIDEKSRYLTDVKVLWRKESKTLGFMPDGGFQDYAIEKHLAVAIRAEKCIGYLLYRVVRDRATIAHFCVARDSRRLGVARAMLNWLIEQTKHLRGIGLSCRVDFEASKTWPRLGFYPTKIIQGRAGKVQMWWQSHGHRDLFTESDPSGIQAAVDVNVFIDLVDGSSEETNALREDWLLPFVTLCYTAEHLIELSRQKDVDAKEKRRGELDQFKMIECSAEEYHLVERKLKPLFPTSMSENDESDFRQLVRSAAAGAEVFVTRDDNLLNMNDEVFRACGLAIVRPAELVSQIDSLQHGHLYQRNQVAGTNEIFQARITSVDDKLIEAVRQCNERNHEISEPLNRFLSNPSQSACYKITDSADNILAAFVVQGIGDLTCIPFFRITDKKREATLCRALLTGIVKDATEKGHRAVLVVDKSVDRAACADIGFLATPAGQAKIVLSGLRTIEETAALLTDDGPHIELLKAALPNAFLDLSTASELEHLLRPLKLRDSALPSYIVSIQPRFAADLFDGRLTKGMLFGADVDLALNPESAYYRSARNQIVTCPSRVLWYVSKDSKRRGSMSIRACSRVVEIAVGKPKELYKRFRRLGVYERKDVMKTAGSSDRDIMAFRFDDTELLKPIKWDQFQPILKKHGVNSNLFSPVRISADLFGELYALALHTSSVREFDH